MQQQTHSATLPAVAPRWQDRLVLGIARSVMMARHPLMMLRFRRKIGYWPNPALPRSSQEKYLWRKLVDRNPLFALCASKLATKQLLAERMPDLPSAPTLWQGADIRDVPDWLLARDIFLKANVGSGSNIVVRAGSSDRARLARSWRRWRAATRWRGREEWNYLEVRQGLLAEPLLDLGGGDLPTDIRVHVVNGRSLYAWIADYKTGRSTAYDERLEMLPERDSYSDLSADLPLTPATESLVRQAMALAPRAAGDVDALRVDFIVHEGRLLAGELTVFPYAGYNRIANARTNQLLSSEWDLTRSHFMRSPHRGLARLYADALRRNL